MSFTGKKAAAEASLKSEALISINLSLSLNLGRPSFVSKSVATSLSNISIKNLFGFFLLNSYANQIALHHVSFSFL